MRDFFKPTEAPPWLRFVLDSIRDALGDIWFRPLRLKNYTTANLPSAPEFSQGIVYDETVDEIAYSDGTQWRYLDSGSGTSDYESHLIEISTDETTVITSGTTKKTVRWPYRFKLEHPDGGLGVRGHLSTASSSGAVSVDINQTAVSMFSTVLSIDESEKTSVTAATPAVLSESIIEDDAELTFDIDGAGTNAAGLKVWLIGYRIGADEFAILLEGDMTDGDDLEMLEGDMTDGDDLLLQEAA